MNKLAIILFVVLFATGAYGETLFERTYGQMGYGDFTVEGANKTGCTEIVFLFPQGIDVMDEGIYPIASIGMQFRPLQTGRIDVNVQLNKEEIAELGIDDFKCSSQECWERLLLPKEKLLEEENTLKVCTGTSNSIVEAVLLKSSGIGLYKTADFSGKEAIQVRAERTGIVIGEKVKITISIHNGGSDSASVNVSYAKPIAEDKNAFVVVEGQTYFDGTVEAGQTVEFSYVIKPRLLGSIRPPPAILHYKNEFGEQESITSNLVEIKIREPEIRVESFIVKAEEKAIIGQPLYLDLAVKNVGSDPLYDLAVELQLAEGLVLSSAQGSGIKALGPNQTKLLPFAVTSSSPGRFAIGCTIAYTDLNAEESLCEESFVVFEQPGISELVYGGIVLAVIAVAIYLYIQFSK